MHVITTLRTYLGKTQSELAKAARLNQADISEMENKTPYGRIQKYQRLAEVLGVPVEAILKNDYRAIPISFFDKHPAPNYLPEPKRPEHLIGRQGEEFILCREQERLSDRFPALANLVLPLFKMREASPGYDILTFDEDGLPYCLEVKTSIHTAVNFQLTDHEMKTAREMTAAGIRYELAYISGWGTDKQTVRNYAFPDFDEIFNVRPYRYACTLKSKPAPISGLAYFRQLRGLRQEHLSKETGIPQCDLSLYETGQRSPRVEFYLKMSELLDATVDQLLAEYDAPPAKTEAANG